MKVRLDFVTNSSSSSFIISKDDITAKQADQLKNYYQVIIDNGWVDDVEYLDGLWEITETSEHIKAYTFVDNLDMEVFLDKIGVNLSKVEWAL